MFIAPLNDRVTDNQRFSCTDSFSRFVAAELVAVENCRMIRTEASHIRTARLALEPLSEGHAHEMVEDDVAPLADVSWVIGAAHQRNGFATEASLEMIQWLKMQGTSRFSAYINPHHRASEVIARKIGLHATLIVDEDGETRWDDEVPRSQGGR